MTKQKEEQIILSSSLNLALHLFYRVECDPTFRVSDFVGYIKKYIEQQGK